MSIQNARLGPASTVPALLAVGLILLTAASARSQSTSDSGNRTREATSSSQWGGNNWLRTNQTKKWRLGVTGENSEIGVVVKDVQRGSAADRARIEPNDIIIVVGGYQVGMVDGRLYDLREEINLRATENGVVSMVVQDHRSLGLAHIRVQLDSAQQVLRGRLFFGGTSSLPSDAVITVQIENVTRPYYQVRNGQVQLRPNGRNSMPFEIAYDPSFIFPEDTYQVRAYVTSGGRTIMDTPRPVRVLNPGGPAEVELQLAPLTTPVASNDSANVITAGYPDFNAIDQQITAIYRHYLNRDPTLLELAALRTIPAINEKIRNLPLEIMASQEYYDAAGNNNAVWLDRVFEEIVKRPPSAAEHDQWMRRFSELRFSRMELLRQLFAQAQKTGSAR